MITEEGNACIGDFGIAAIITDPAIVELDSMTTSKPGAVRYMAPELLAPFQFNLADRGPSKESDVYSFAMTAYEVFFPCLAVCVANEHLPVTRSSRGTFRMMRGGRALLPSPLYLEADHLAQLTQRLTAGFLTLSGMPSSTVGPRLRSPGYPSTYFIKHSPNWSRRKRGISQSLGMVKVSMM